MTYCTPLNLPSKARFWGWSENKREEELDFKELSQRAQEGKPLYGESHQPLWVQEAAARNSTFSQLKLGERQLPLTIPYTYSLLIFFCSCRSLVRNILVLSGMANVNNALTGSTS